MGSVNISFLGVCTIFQNLPSLVPPNAPINPNFPLSPSRVVLVTTSLFMEQLSRIDPHIAKIQFVADDVSFQGPFLPPVDPPMTNVFSLAGVSLSIVNAVNILTLEPSLGCLPSLQARLNPAAELGPPAPLVYTPQPTLAAAWFDVSVGNSWNAYKLTPIPHCDTVPSISILNIETEGPPQLLVQPWDESEPTIVTLTSESSTPEITVMNFADGRGVVEDDRDFLLNYLTAATFPLSSVIIPDTNCPTPSPIAYRFPRCGDAGPGCSNSNYP